jgi:hypothetical protein
VARGALRGAMSAWLGLIVLQTVTTKGGSGKVAGAFDAVNGLVERALSPAVAAIPDHSSTKPTTSIGGTIPNPTVPSLPSSAVIPRPSTVPIPGRPNPS